MRPLLQDPNFYVNESTIDKAEAEEAIDGDLRLAGLMWSRLNGIVPRFQGGIDRRHDEETGRSGVFLWWSVDLGRGFKLFPDSAKCYFTDDRGEQHQDVEYGHRISFDEVDFIEQLVHQLNHATKSALVVGSITCPECGTPIAVATSQQLA